jgi:hypothetical protein
MAAERIDNDENEVCCNMTEADISDVTLSVLFSYNQPLQIEPLL